MTDHDPSPDSHEPTVGCLWGLAMSALLVAIVFVAYDVLGPWLSLLVLAGVPVARILYPPTADEPCPDGCVMHRRGDVFVCSVCPARRDRHGRPLPPIA